MVDISIVNGVYKPPYNWGAPPCIYPLVMTNIAMEKIMVALIEIDDFPSERNLHL